MHYCGVDVRRITIYLWKPTLCRRATIQRNSTATTLHKNNRLLSGGEQFSGWAKLSLLGVNLPSPLTLGSANHDQLLRHLHVFPNIACVPVYRHRSEKKNKNRIINNSIIHYERITFFTLYFFERDSRMISVHFTINSLYNLILKIFIELPAKWVIWKSVFSSLFGVIREAKIIIKEIVRSSSSMHRQCL